MEAVVTVVTFEDIFQYEAEKKGKYSEDYKKFSAQIILDKQYMAGLGDKPDIYFLDKLEQKPA